MLTASWLTSVTYRKLNISACPGVSATEQLSELLEIRLIVNQASGDEIQCLHTRQSKCPSLRYWTHRARHSSTARYFDNWRTSAQNDAGALRHGNGRRMSAILLRHRYPTRTKPTGAFKNKILGMDSNLTLGPVSRNQYFLHAIEWRERA